MPQAASSFGELDKRFDHPAVRVLVRELTHLARAWERGMLAWPGCALPLADTNPSLPGLERIEARLPQRLTARTSAVDQGDWVCFARTVLATVGISNDVDHRADAGTPHPISVMALRLIWGAERFAELPTVMLKPPPAPFLDQLAHLPTPEGPAPPEQFDHFISEWLQERQPAPDDVSSPLAVGDVRGFTRFVAGCRAVGQMRQELALEDVAAGYLAWVRLLRANPQQLSDISTGWWSSKADIP